MAVSDFEQQIDGTDDAESRGSYLQRSPRLSKGSGDTNASSTSTPKVQSLDSSTSTPLSSWDAAINGVKVIFFIRLTQLLFGFKVLINFYCRIRRARRSDCRSQLHQVHRSPVVPVVVVNSWIREIGRYHLT